MFQFLEDDPFLFKRNKNSMYFATHVNKHIDMNHSNMFLHTTHLCQLFVDFVEISTHDI